VEPLLAATAHVVEIRGVGGLEFETDPMLPRYPTQLVLLGTVSESGGGRVPSRTEIVDGVLAAVRRALDDHPASVHQIGLSRPMVR
jgi:hypothetical protein